MGKADKLAWWSGPGQCRRSNRRLVVLCGANLLAQQSADQVVAEALPARFEPCRSRQSILCCQLCHPNESAASLRVRQFPGTKARATVRPGRTSSAPAGCCHRARTRSSRADDPRCAGLAGVFRTQATWAGVRSINRGLAGQATVSTVCRAVLKPLRRLGRSRHRPHPAEAWC